MDTIIAIIIAFGILFGGGQGHTDSRMEADAHASLEARGMSEGHINATCKLSEARYVDSGEHGTTHAGEFSVWSITDENLFHHFTCN